MMCNGDPCGSLNYNKCWNHYVDTLELSVVADLLDLLVEENVAKTTSYYCCRFTEFSEMTVLMNDHLKNRCHRRGKDLCRSNN